FGRRLRPRERSLGAVGTPDGYHAGTVTRIRPGSGSLARHPPPVIHPHPDRAGSGRRSAGRVVQPVRRSGRSAGLGRCQWLIDAHNGSYASDLEDILSSAAGPQVGSLTLGAATNWYMALAAFRSTGSPTPTTTSTTPRTTTSTSTTTVTVPRTTTTQPPTATS